MLQDGYQALGSISLSTTLSADIKTFGCELVAFEMLTVASTPAIKAYGAGPGGTFKPIPYRLITQAGVESTIDADTGSGTLSQYDRIIVPNLGYDQIRIITTTGTATVSATRNFFGGAVYELQRIRDSGITVVSAESTSTPYHLIADGTDELLISASARRLTQAQIFSLNDAPVFAKFYDKATAPAETDTPIWVVGSPANATAANGAGNSPAFPTGGIALTNGLGVRVVKGLADNSDTAADASENIVNAAYKTA